MYKKVSFNLIKNECVIIKNDDTTFKLSTDENSCIIRFFMWFISNDNVIYLNNKQHINSLKDTVIINLGEVA